jgi:hypothetical protein
VCLVGFRRREEDCNLSGDSFSRCEWVLVLRRKQAIQSYGYPNGNKAVSEIKGRPVEVRQVEIEKIDDFAVQESVNKVSDGASENKRESHRQYPFGFRQPPQNCNQENYRQQGKENEEGKPKHVMAVRKHAECRALVPDIRQIKKVLDNRNGCVKRKRAVDNQLGSLIEQNGRPEDDADPFALCSQAFTPERSTAAHRSQTIGCAESLPTLVR